MSMLTFSTMIYLLSTYVRIGLKKLSFNPPPGRSSIDSMSSVELQ